MSDAETLYFSHTYTDVATRVEVTVWDENPTWDFQVFAGGGFFTVENGTFATKAEAEEFSRTNTAGLRTCRIVPTGWDEKAAQAKENAARVPTPEEQAQDAFYGKAYDY